MGFFELLRQKRAAKRGPCEEVHSAREAIDYIISNMHNSFFRRRINENGTLVFDEEDCLMGAYSSSLKEVLKLLNNVAPTAPVNGKDARWFINGLEALYHDIDPYIGSDDRRHYKIYFLDLPTMMGNGYIKHHIIRKELIDIPNLTRSRFSYYCYALEKGEKKQYANFSITQTNCSTNGISYGKALPGIWENV